MAVAADRTHLQKLLQHLLHLTWLSTLTRFILNLILLNHAKLRYGLIFLDKVVDCVHGLGSLLQVMPAT